MIEELSALTKNNEGNTLLYFEVVDGERNIRLEMFARGVKIKLRKELIDYLEENENITFKIN